jgi:hypothetical protein
MPDRSQLTSERLDECWMTLYDIAEADRKHLSLSDREVLQAARMIVNRWQLRVGKPKEKATDMTLPAAQNENT